mmetsp:Transcript_11283/g.15741  ORF Transcript_11283/g.15741 Transcript_11283/m.15741 type:complete len:241 (+) Transcript_11283:75-797(+)|eukprot:CAMPEP_0184484060 /NCGR_PEP_ID=MMETSP0113_2-20130426/5753_1 /TAXON_ID=91329 /ORGANISM="Norrisiella sphaerica, Strain BC52" /LENGTH=240 /DNA_ID=CAMNT_0026864833 /DNA_START=79 /DNA_END=801 /DNA_ORIENTATION=+
MAPEAQSHTINVKEGKKYGSIESTASPGLSNAIRGNGNHYTEKARRAFLSKPLLATLMIAAGCSMIGFASVRMFNSSRRQLVTYTDAVSPPVAPVAGDPTVPRTQTTQATPANPATPSTPTSPAANATATTPMAANVPVGSQACPNGPPVAPGTPCPGPDGVAPALSPDQAAQIAKQASDSAAAAAVASQAAQTAQNLKNQAYAAHQAEIAQEIAEKNARAAAAAQAAESNTEKTKKKAY